MSSFYTFYLIGSFGLSPKEAQIDLFIYLAAFAAGTLLLESETTPLAPAAMETIDARHARLTLIEGRYHQVRRMFAATGNRVLSLHRSRTGRLGLEGLEPGQWRIVPRDEAEAKLFT